MDKNNILINLTTDNQENLRFIESKTTIITAIIGGIFIFYLGESENIVRYYTKFNCYNIILFYLTLISISACGFFLFKIIMPISNPVNFLPLEFKSYPNLYLSTEKLSVKKHNLEEYKNSFINDAEMSNAIELEFLKTSFIRNEKIKNFKRLVFSLLILIVIFLVHVVVLKTNLIYLIPKTK